MTKYITNYWDEYANTGNGRVVILGEQINDSIKIISPISFKKRWSSISDRDVLHNNKSLKDFTGHNSLQLKIP